jgi:hypothetical protein
MTGNKSKKKVLNDKRICNRRLKCTDIMTLCSFLIVSLFDRLSLSSCLLWCTEERERERERERISLWIKRWCIQQEKFNVKMYKHSSSLKSFLFSCEIKSRSSLCCHCVAFPSNFTFELLQTLSYSKVLLDTHLLFGQIYWGSWHENHSWLLSISCYSSTDK